MYTEHVTNAIHNLRNHVMHDMAVKVLTSEPTRDLDTNTFISAIALVHHGIREIGSALDNHEQPQSQHLPEDMAANATRKEKRKRVKREKKLTSFGSEWEEKNKEFQGISVFHRGIKTFLQGVMNGKRTGFLYYLVHVAKRQTTFFSQGNFHTGH